MSNYSDLLKDPRWQKKRLQIMERDNFQCQICGDIDSTLNIHHLWYKQGVPPWEYENKHLVTLCETCHEIEREERDSSEKDLILILRQSGFSSIELRDLCSGFINIEHQYNDLSMSSLIRYFISNLKAQKIISKIEKQDLGWRNPK